MFLKKDILREWIAKKCYYLEASGIPSLSYWFIKDIFNVYDKNNVSLHVRNVSLHVRVDVTLAIIESYPITDIYNFLKDTPL